MEKDTKKSPVRRVIKSAFDTVLNRVPPHSIDAEIAVLGAMMLNREVANKIIGQFAADSVKPLSGAKISEAPSKVFYDPRHQEIFKAILELDKKNIAPDIISLSEHLKQMGTLEIAGGTYYISEINRLTPTYAHFDNHAHLVQEYYFKRCLIEAAEDILEKSYDETTDALKEVDEAEEKIFQIAEKRITRKYQNMHNLATETYKLIEKIMSNDSSEGGVPTGFKYLDNMLNGGLQKSDLIILAARPSMGKSAFALNIAMNAANVARKNNVPVGFFSLEMDAKQLCIRMLSTIEEINTNEIIMKRNHDQLSKIVHGMGELAKLPIFFDDSPAMTIMELRAKCRRMKSEQNVGLIVVDYLQLIQSPKSESREREISIISAQLKQIARDLEIPIIALSQLNRAIEARIVDGKDIRPEKTPVLSDLRESGSIEQDADVVMFIHRPEYYLKNDPNKEEKLILNNWKNLAQIIVEKHRNGRTGSTNLNFFSENGSFTDRMLEENALSGMPAYINNTGNSTYQNNNYQQNNPENVPQNHQTDPEDVVF